MIAALASQVGAKEQQRRLASRQLVAGLGFLVIVLNVIADLLYAVLDPSIRYE